MPKYRFIRDSDVYQIPESRIRVLETRTEIIDFSIAELHLLLEQLRNGDCRDLDLYADIFEILFNVADHSLIELELIDNYGNEKLDKYGAYTKYLMRLDEEDK
jgi:hypothetical protein